MTSESIANLFVALPIVLLVFLTLSKILGYIFCPRIKRYAKMAERVIYSDATSGLIWDISKIERITEGGIRKYRINLDCSTGKISYVLERITASVPLLEGEATTLARLLMGVQRGFEHQTVINRVNNVMSVMHVSIYDGHYNGHRRVILAFYEKPVEPQYQP